jgi:CxxC motif-containing protein (DUF1111 family)
MRRLTVAVAQVSPFLAAAAAAAAIAGFTPGEELPGGAATSQKPRNANAFSYPSANMPPDQVLDFRVGDGIFRKQWVSAPSSTHSSNGLGPLFNARACQNCHLKDGRGHPPATGETPSSLILKLAVPAAGKTRATEPEPTYGRQLQTFAIQGFAAEGNVAIAHEPVRVELAGGETVVLQRPLYRITDLAYGPMAEETAVSPRVAPPMTGLGLLELVPEAEIVARADPQDRDGDGIRGVAQRVWSGAQQKEMLGRFGWKAAAPTIADQTATAFAMDMGLSSPVLRQSAGDCTQRQPACRAAPNGDDEREGVEVTQAMFDLVVLYARNLAVPARPTAKNPLVLRGKQAFAAIGCAACHVPRQVTGADPRQPHLSHQTIYPYTDLLLHDMGEDLADGVSEGLANGKQWRTPPLWGLGLTQTVSGHTRLLHDGRARNVLEAVLWHGGEALGARERFRNLDKAERDALLAFLQSL